VKRLLVTFDVEELDWGRPCAGITDWDPGSPSVRGLAAILPMLEERSLPATFFCTAVFARERPELVRRLVEHGHEVASHGLDHRDDYHRLSPDVARDRLAASRRLLEDVTGTAIRGVRTPRLAPCHPAILAEAGFAYDASPQPTWSGGGLRGARRSRQPSRQAGIVLAPLSVLPALRLPVAWYVLRLLGARATSVLARLAGVGTPWIHLYFHPWEGADLRAHVAPHPLAWRTGPAWVEGLRRLLTSLAGSFPAATVGEAVDAWLARDSSRCG
jgi:peptidoglycan/xylan/chitin deacetylase (PgdA/CDA1 family)